MLTSHPSYVQDKILQSTGRGRSVTVTNDGATILKSLHIDNPAAKVLVGILSIDMLLNDSLAIMIFKSLLKFYNFSCSSKILFFVSTPYAI
jgi:hypothetical protein